MENHPANEGNGKMENGNLTNANSNTAANILQAAQEDAAFNLLLKLKTGEREYVIGKDRVPLGAEYIAKAAAWTKYWLKFEDGEVVDRRGPYRVAHGEKPVPREELDDLDEASWPSGRDGKP